MIYSMTGYAALAEELPHGTLSVEIRSVNHRYLDVTLRLPDEFRSFEPALRELVGARITRGKVDCRVGFQKSPTSSLSLQLNMALVDQLAELDRQVRMRLPGSAPLAVNEVLRWPGTIETDVLPLEELREHAQVLLGRVLHEFAQSRAREGEKLRMLLLERVDRMEALVQRVKPKIPYLVQSYQERLAARLRDAAAELDEDRIRQELVMFSSRVDVEEELSRLATHLTEIRRILSAGGTVGKRMDFIMQELNRESNTLGSKSVDIEVSQAAVELKVLIEQMREQVQNIE